MQAIGLLMRPCQRSALGHCSAVGDRDLHRWRGGNRLSHPKCRPIAGRGRACGRATGDDTRCRAEPDCQCRWGLRWVCPTARCGEPHTRPARPRRARNRRHEQPRCDAGRPWRSARHGHARAARRHPRTAARTTRRRRPSAPVRSVESGRSRGSRTSPADPSPTPRRPKPQRQPDDGTRAVAPRHCHAPPPVPPHRRNPGSTHHRPQRRRHRYPAAALFPHGWPDRRPCRAPSTDWRRPVAHRHPEPRRLAPSRPDRDGGRRR